VTDPVTVDGVAHEQAAFEVFAEADGWRWRLRDGETVLALPVDTFADTSAARKAIERVRLDLSTLAGTAIVDADRRFDRESRVVVRQHGDLHEWALVDGEEILAVPPATFESEAAARTAVDRVEQLAVGAVPVYFAGAEDDAYEYDPFEVDSRALKRSLRGLLTRGRKHRRYLDRIDTRIVVMGIRGKSSTTRRLGDVFDRRGYDTLIKITGNRPHVLHNGEYIPIHRGGPRVTLYENIRTFWRFIPILDGFDADDVAIFENQGITEYTTRMVNQRFVQPHVVLLTNVRQDHQDTLGQNRADIARSFARSVPKGAHVVSGEQHPVLDDYLREETEKLGATFEQVQVPERHASLLGAETVHAVNTVLEHLDMRPLPAAELDGYLEAIQPQWTHLPTGAKLFDAAQVNDIESTEAVRRALAGDDSVVPFVYLRADRRSRTASFATYLNQLADRGLIDRAHAAGDYTDVFARKVDVPVTEHPPDADASVVLDELVDEGQPIVTMGNAVADFMRAFEKEVERRALQVVHEDPDAGR
jgi:hypothetical protein